MPRRRPPGKVRDREIKTTPEKMNRACFAKESGSEARENLACRKQNAQEAIDVFGIVRRMHGVLLERNAVRDLARHRHDGDIYAELAQRDHQVFVEFGDTHGPEHQLTEMSLACPHPQHVVDEIEIDLKAAAAPRNWRCRQPTRGHIKRHMPGVIEPGCQGEPDLAY